MFSKTPKTWIDNLPAETASSQVIQPVTVYLYWKHFHNVLNRTVLSIFPIYENGEQLVSVFVFVFVFAYCISIVPYCIVLSLLTAQEGGE